MSMSTKRLLGQIGLYFLVAIIVIYAVFPFYYAILSSLKSGSELFQVNYFPVHWNFGNYISVFEGQPFARNLLNSVFVSASVVVVSLFLGVTAAFALGRVQFRGRGILLLTILGVSMFPQVAVLSGMFELIRALGLYNNLFGLIFTYTIFTLPFTVWVLPRLCAICPRSWRRRPSLTGPTPG